MTAHGSSSQGSSLGQDKKKRQRTGHSGHQVNGQTPTSSTPRTNSSQQLEDLASQITSPREAQQHQNYALRSKMGETGKDFSSVNLRPSYAPVPQSPTKPMNVPEVTSKETGVDESWDKSVEGASNSFNNIIISSRKDSEKIESAVNDKGNLIPKDKADPPPPPPAQEVVRLADIMARLDSLTGVREKIDAMAEDVKQLRYIKETTHRLCKEMVEVKESVTDLQTSVASLEAKEEETELNQQAIAKELVDLKQKVIMLESQQQAQQAVAQQAEAQQPISQADLNFFKLKMDAAMRGNNLIFEGIQESRSEREGSTRQQVQSFCRNTLGISYAEIDKTYRLGKPRAPSAPPRPILVRLVRPDDREDIWRAKSRLADLEDNQFSIREDLPTQLRPTMAALMRVVHNAKKYPQKYNAFVRDFKVFINGVPYEADKLESLPRDLRPSHTSTPGNTRVVVFFGKESRFSNHYPSPFNIDDTNFSTMEQYLAHSRARFANDQHLMDRAMESSDPADAKRILNLLREAPGQSDWEEERHDILIAGLLAKFRQNPDLKKYLLSSEDRQLGEASRNKVWGIGMTLTSKDRLNVQRWTGDNLLGRTLMEVRHILTTEATTTEAPEQLQQPRKDSSLRETSPLQLPPEQPNPTEGAVANLQEADQPTPTVEHTEIFPKEPTTQVQQNST